MAVAGRLFAFGCSFTNYRWPTWADILGRQYQEFQNWGQAGAGNHYIFNAVQECDQRMAWTAEDTVIVCWTNVMRDDRYVQGRGWITLGNVMDAKIYTKEFLIDYVNERGNLIRDLAFMKATKVLLESRGVTWRFLQMCDINQPEPWDPKQMQFPDVLDLYRDVLDCMLPSYIEVLGQNFWFTNRAKRIQHGGGNPDYHPMPIEHLQYLDAVLPGWVADDAVRAWAMSNDMTPRGRTGSNQNRRL